MMYTLAIFVLVLSILRTGATQQLATAEEWWHSVCRGERLDQAMMWPSPYADSYLQPINSPWDGYMYKELAQWGYVEFGRSQMCDFDTFWGLDEAFKGLGMDPQSTQRNGPNICTQVSHGDPQKLRPDGSFWKLSEQTYTAPGGRINRVCSLRMHKPILLTWILR